MRSMQQRKYLVSGKPFSNLPNVGSDLVVMWSVEALDLSYVGEELDGQFVWVYQEIENQIEIQAMTVVSTALRDIWPSQSNLVNIERSGEVLSLLFAGAVEVLTVKL